MSKSCSEYILIGIDSDIVMMGHGLLSIWGQHAKVLTMGVTELSRYEDYYTHLGCTYKRVTGLIGEFLPDEMALKAPSYGKDV